MSNCRNEILLMWCNALWATLCETVLAVLANHDARVLGYFTILLLPVLFALPRSRKEDHAARRTSLQALMTVIVPTCSLWPSRYTQLARASCSHISIPLEWVIEDLLKGKIELRNPVDDLADLVGPGATAYGCTISISIGWKWWIDECQSWTVIKQKPDSLLPKPPTFSPFLRPLVSKSLDSTAVISLDYLPSGSLPSLIAGCKLSLEFTAFSSSFRRLSTPQVISAIPFIHPHARPRWPRSPVSVLKQLLASYGPDLVVDSLTNISADYETGLHHLLDRLSEEQKTYHADVKAFGRKGWRQDVFLLALEAALVRRGWIERWVVQITIK